MTDARGSPPPTRTSLRDFEPLLPAERIVLRAAASGEIAKIGYRRPRATTPESEVRGGFLAFMACGGGAGAPVAGRQLQIMGARVLGRLDLAGATLPLSLWLYRCSLIAAPLLDGAHVLGHLSFADCTLPGLHAGTCRIDGDLSISAGSNVDGEINLARARIGGDLSCQRLQMRSIGGDGARAAPCRFVADRAEIGGDLTLLGGVEVVGEMRFVGAQIGGDLRASGARMTADIDAAGTRRVALNLDRVRVGGGVALDAGFSASGAVRLQQARIGGDLDCSAADFDAVGDASWGDDGAGLRLDHARIGGALRLLRLQNPLQGASLTDTRIGTLIDDESTWGQHHVLDGFSYRRFGAGAPTDAATRLGWLMRQRALHLDADFRPGPWRQVVGVLREMGHARDADRLLIARERHLRRIGRIGAAAPRGLRWLPRLAHAAHGLLAGHGHRPRRLLAVAAAVWLLCSGAYWAAAQRGAFAPAAALLAADPRLAVCRPECAGLPISAPAFQAALYSLDVLLPLGDLQQQRHWAPVRGGLGRERWTGLEPLPVLIGAEAASGWLVLLIWLAALRVAADRDRRVSAAPARR